ncbi:MAG: DEAD/DEAH box helicase [Proteobacteria bacterium]|nr:DEAD/DEAH box helicase [Desulfobacteraceae bacterium]MBU4013501.1 DEAD/DEAH box helicase [Pseudomonadota bacterium]MBU4068122.1 DEAD/DEAH box helicase [Pseudomonadota bacterium]MBU4127789.1 DEAD/DEAH box helicase [Pseudomonadota bacterium]
MNRLNRIYAPGARIVVRDAEWLIRRVDRTSTGGQALNVIGISELVKDKVAIFLTEIEMAIEILDPAETKIVQDKSSSYQASLLYMESLLRKTPPTDENLYIGHNAAMDSVPYQLDPAIQALKQPRQRILIADAVGLGKTLEAGILLSELIRRGKGKRILVLAVKSMLTQFQKEMWSRFTIPLTRLDSVGIQRIRSRIPTNHNPFYYYDKSIISIDTLKQDAEYRTYIENAYWDVIVIDEAHNVAQRGHGSSLRAKLAKLLARRSDTLIMLSATPHDGKARSFASLMNMLDPTAIANPEDYGPEDIKGLYIRRFKKDIHDQVESAFKERQIRVAYCDASKAEEDAFDVFTNIEFTQIDKARSAGQLFKITLEKSLFSSPAACLDTINNRIRRFEKTEDFRFAQDIETLLDLHNKVERITPDTFSKYQKLLDIIRDKKHWFGWTGKDKPDRLVIFTERIETLGFLHANLRRDLELNEDQISVLHGGMSDVDQQRIVEDFGKEEAPVRLLLASDVASEGINLHYLSHRMIHFDIPWSLMVFQQRNGRIDRYGQERTPQIVYLATQSENKKIRGDMRILELLIQKDEETVKNIGDPAEFMGVYDIEEEENITAKAIEYGQSPEEFEKSVANKAIDPLAILFGDEEPPSGKGTETKILSMPSLFEDDYTYLNAAIGHLRHSGGIQATCYPNEKRIDLTAPEDLKQRFRFLPVELWPENGLFILSTDKETIQKEIKRSRKDEKAWPRIHYLWHLNPIVEWANDKLLAAFGRHEAPVLELQGALNLDEVVFILSGLIPNLKSHSLVHRWFGVSFNDGKFTCIEEFESLVNRIGLGKKNFPNRDEIIEIETLQQMLPKAIEQAELWMSNERKKFEELINAKLNNQLNALENLRKKQYVQLEFKFGGSKLSEKIIRSRKEKQRREIDTIFDEYMDWVEDTMTTEDKPYIQVIAVLKGIN